MRTILCLGSCAIVAALLSATSMAAGTEAAVARVATVWCKGERGEGARPPVSIEAALPRNKSAHFRAYYFSGRHARSGATPPVWVVAPRGWKCSGRDDSRGTYVDALPGKVPGDQPHVRGTFLLRGKRSTLIDGAPWEGQSETASQEVKFMDYFGINWAWWLPNRKRSAELGCYWAKSDVCATAYGSFDALVRAAP